MSKESKDVVPVVGEPVAWKMEYPGLTLLQILSKPAFTDRAHRMKELVAAYGAIAIPKYDAPAYSIPRARLDELLVAEKRVRELEGAFAVLEGLSPLECMNLKTCAENGEWSVQELLVGRVAALAANKEEK